MGNSREADSTHLYRHFDAAGQLLYVGISISTVARLVQHRDSASWFAEIARVTVEKFETRRGALLAEAAAILNECPLFNRQLPISSDIARATSVKAGGTRVEKRLTAKEVAGAVSPGSYADGGGLTLEVDEAGRRRWIFRYRFKGRRRHMGLGTPEQVTLAQARALRDRWRAIRLEGRDPVDTRRGNMPPTGLSIGAGG